MTDYLDQLAKAWGLSGYAELRAIWDSGHAVAVDIHTGKCALVPFNSPSSRR